MRARLPAEGRSWDELAPELEALKRGDRDWRGGRVPLYVFRATEEAYAVGLRAFEMYFSENALGGRRAFPSVARMEREVVEIGLTLFSAPDGADGTMTTGGTESILVAVKAAREAARAEGRKPPFSIVAPVSAHPAFDKAGELMDMPVRRTALGPGLRGDPEALLAAADEGTIMLVASAPCFPHGVVDSVEAIGEAAAQRGLWLHVDACVGGYLAPFARRIGRPVPAFDFALAGVRSLSADLHKFGFCPKPASTVFFREAADLERQAFDFDGWPHGRFVTGTLTGTRPAGAVAAAWAVMHHLGEGGYCAIAQRLVAMTDAYVAGIEAIDGLALHARPDLSLLNFGSDAVDIGAVAAAMDRRGWLPGMTQRPPGLHLMLSLLHEQAREAYLADLAASVAEAREGASGRVSTGYN